MKHIKLFEEYQVKPKHLKCDDCEHIGTEVKFFNHYKKPSRCPKCGSRNYDYYDIPKPKISPMPQKIKRN